MPDNLKDPHEQAKNPSEQTDELDLMALLENAISFFRHYRILLIASSLIGLLAGILSYSLSPKQYSSTLILRSNPTPSYYPVQGQQREYILNNSEQISMIELWDDLLYKRSYKTLAKILQCREALLDKVGSLTAEEIDKPRNANMPSGFTVVTLVKDTTILEELQQGIINGLQNNDYAKSKLDAERSGLEEMIAKIKSNMASLDSTKSDIAGTLRRPKSSGAPVILDISGISAQLVDLQRQLLQCEDQLKFSGALQVLEPFEKPGGRKADSPHLRMIVAGLGGGFIIGYVLSLCLYIRRKMKNYSKR